VGGDEPYCYAAVAVAFVLGSRRSVNEQPQALTCPTTTGDICHTKGLIPI
jgi:hypothetical protein